VKIQTQSYSPRFQGEFELKGLELVHLRLCPASAALKKELDPNERVLFPDAVCFKCMKKCTTEKQFENNKCSNRLGRDRRRCSGRFYKKTK
jgi:hypothetical protein